MAGVTHAHHPAPRVATTYVTVHLARMAKRTTFRRACSTVLVPASVASDVLRGTETAHPIHCTSQEEASQEALLTTLAAFSSNITSISAHHTTANTASGEL